MNAKDPDELARVLGEVHAKAVVVDLREHIEALFREKERALDMAAAERDRAAEVLRDEQRRAMQTAEAEREKAASALRAASDRAISDNYERLHELLVTLFQEKDRALTMASEEREKSAQVLREEQHRSLTTAEKEREKAASALRDTLAQAIKEGDERLREHIANQVMQINATLKSGELLEIQRIRGVRDELVEKIEANTREFRQIQNAAQAAVQKAEEAQQRVNISQNEFRGQLSDQANTLMPRKESESRHEETARQIRELRDEIGKLRTDLAVGPSGLGTLEGRVTRSEGRHEGSSAIIASLIAVAGVLAVSAGVIVAIVTH